MIPPALPESEPARLRALQSYEVLDTANEPAFDALTKLAARLLDVPIALVSLVDEDRQWFKSRYGLEVPETPRDISFCGHVVATARPLVVEDATTDPRFMDNPLVVGLPGIRFYAGFPMSTSDGLVLGTLCAMDRRTRQLSAEDLEALQLLARQTMDQLDRRRENRLLAERGALLQAVLDTAVDPILVIDRHGIIDLVNPAVERVFGFSPSELLGRNVSLLMPSPDQERHDQYLERYCTTGERRVIGIGRDVTARRKDGSTFPAELSVSELWVGRKRQFTGVIRDVSERHEAVAKVQSALASVERSNRNLLAILDLLQVGAVLVNADRRIEFISGPAQAMVGVDPADAFGKTCDEALPVGTANLENMRAVMAEPPGRRPRVPMIVVTPSRRRRRLEIEVLDDPRAPGGRLLLLHDVTELYDLRSASNRASARGLIGTSPAMAEVSRAILEVARGDWSTLIEGETGTGKELAARAIHAASPRHEERFVAINCGGLTESLLSSQLFGHRRGSFTGAVADQMGLFEAAHKGTLLLDEIGEIPMGIQAHLLRVLQEKEIVRVGETQPRKVDVRILAATNRDLDTAVVDGRFRRDLLYRIRVGRVSLPPLRDRVEDIPMLAEVFLAEARAGSGKTIRELDRPVLEALAVWPWPGNVRELKSAIEHAVIRCHGDIVRIGDLPPEIAAARPSAAPDARSPRRTEAIGLQPLLEADERDRIVAALRQARGNRQEAARLLGVSRATFYRRLRACGLELGEPR